MFVLGTGTLKINARSFSRKNNSSDSVLVTVPYASQLVVTPRGFAYVITLLLTPKSSYWSELSFSVTPSLLKVSTGILTCCPSTTLVSLALGPD